MYFLSKSGLISYPDPRRRRAECLINPVALLLLQKGRAEPGQGCLLLQAAYRTFTARRIREETPPAWKRSEEGRRRRRRGEGRRTGERKGEQEENEMGRKRREIE